MPTPPLPEPLIPTVLGPTRSPRPLPLQSPRAKNITVSSRELGCPRGPAKSHKPSTAAIWGPCSLPLFSLQHLLGCLDKPLSFYGRQFSLCQMGPLTSDPAHSQGFKGTKVPWREILRGGCHLGPRFIQRPGGLQVTLPHPPWSPSPASAELALSWMEPRRRKGGQGRAGGSHGLGLPRIGRSVWFGLPGSGAGSASGLGLGGMGVFGLTLW